MRFLIIPVLLLIAVGLLLVSAYYVPSVGGALWRAAAPAFVRLAPDAVVRVPARTDDRFVVLTIDDAPSSRTDEILALLDAHGATATFFIHTDQITEQNAEAMAAMAASGHDLGHHMPADAAAHRLSAEAFRADFAKAETALSTIPGRGAERYFRPPLARYNARTMAPALREFGYAEPLASLGGDKLYVLAGFVPWDAGGATNSADPIRNRIVAARYADQLAAGLYPGAIVVFHDGEQGGRAPRLDAALFSLDRFLQAADDQGYAVVSLSDALARTTQ